MKHARGGGAVLRALAHVAAEKGGVRSHCGAEYHYYANYRHSSTPNGTEAAEDAGLEHKFTAWITVTGAPAPARCCVFNELHD